MVIQGSRPLYLDFKISTNRQRIYFSDANHFVVGLNKICLKIYIFFQAYFLPLNIHETSYRSVSAVNVINRFVIVWSKVYST